MRRNGLTGRAGLACRRVSGVGGGAQEGAQAHGVTALRFVGPRMRMRVLRAALCQVGTRARPEKTS